VRDVADRFDEQRVRCLQPRIILDVAPARARAEVNPVIVDPDSAQSAEIAKVDEKRRLREPKRHRRKQALPAGDDLRFARAGREESHDFGRGRRRRVFEIR
jgi:hypothetical protein